MSHLVAIKAMAGKAHLTVVPRRFESSEASRSSTYQERLEGWKQIAAYLHREVRTVQRWEQAEHLPAHRQLHVKLSTVYAFKPELDRWMARRSPSPRGEGAVSLAVRDFANL